MGTINNGNSISTSLSDATNVVKKSNFLYIFQMKDIDRESMIYMYVCNINHVYIPEWS